MTLTASSAILPGPRTVDLPGGFVRKDACSECTAYLPLERMDGWPVYWEPPIKARDGRGRRAGRKVRYVDQEQDDSLTCPNLETRVDRVDVASGRSVACASYSGKFVSLTTRLTRGTYLSDSVLADPDRLPKSEYAPDNKFGDWLTSVKQIVDALASLLPEPLTGLVAVTGATNSAKSKIARGLVHHRVSAEMARFRAKPVTRRRPHLLTLEDPIEEWWARKRNPDGILTSEPEDPRELQRLGLDYTPRHLGVDTKDLATALVSALRQTPSAVYVGEARTTGDWRDILEFAGTGHLVITTGHAGSLTEAMSRIFGDVRTPSDRGYVAERILAVVHLRSVAPDPNGSAALLLPTMWVRTTQSVASLVTDGFASLVPASTRGRTSTLGRAYFAKTLLSQPPTKRENGSDVVDSAVVDARRVHQAWIEKKALEWDLLGV